MSAAKATSSLSRSLGVGVLAGVVAGIAMAMFAMVAAATYQGTGFFTPMYHIASTFIDPTAMETSMQEAGTGNLFYFSLGPAVLGMAIHMMTAMVFGVLFIAGADRLGLRGGIAPLAGLVYGLAVFAVMSLLILPIVAEVFGGGPPISDMPQMVGYPTFVIEHALFGLVLGFWPLRWPERGLAAESDRVRHREQAA